MSTNKRYRFEVLVRPDETEWVECEDYGERPYKIAVTAISLLMARRKVLEISWANGLLVRRFLRIQFKGQAQ